MITLEIVVLSPKLAEPRPQDRGEDDHADEHDKKELGSDLGNEDDLQRSQPVRKQGCPGGPGEESDLAIVAAIRKSRVPGSAQRSMISAISIVRPSGGRRTPIMADPKSNVGPRPAVVKRSGKPTRHF